MLEITSIKRRNSKTVARDREVTASAQFFQLWGFWDYIAARSLLVAILESLSEPDLPKARGLEEFQKQLTLASQKHTIDLLYQGQLIWPACALAATSVEKYCKALVTVSRKTPAEESHLNRRLINAVRNAVPNIFEVIDQGFIEILRKLYDARYPNKKRKNSLSETGTGYDWDMEIAARRLWPWEDFSPLLTTGNARSKFNKKSLNASSEATDIPVISVSTRGILAELDFTIMELDSCVQTCFNSIPEESSYDLCRRLRYSLLWKENHILLGQDKLTFWRQKDIYANLSLPPGSKDISITWHPADNRGLLEFFYAGAGHRTVSQQERDDKEQLAKILKPEARIRFYEVEKIHC